MSRFPSAPWTQGTLSSGAGTLISPVSLGQIASTASATFGASCASWAAVGDLGSHQIHTPLCGACRDCHPDGRVSGGIFSHGSVSLQKPDSRAVTPGRVRCKD